MSIQRIINLHCYKPDTLRFNSDKEMNDFYCALGRMVAYGLCGIDSENDSGKTQVVGLNIDLNKEITGAYYAPVPYEPEAGYTEHKKFYAIDDTLAPFKVRVPFVMGAIPRPDGYSFHS